MAEKTLCEQQLNALEFQTTQAYEALKRAVETHDLQDAVWAVKVYSGLETSLNVATDYSNYTGFQRGQKLNIALDKFILQYVIGEISSLVLENAAQDRKHGQERKTEKTTVTEESLTESIASDMPYIELKSMALKLAKAHKYDAIVTVLTYVREQYS